MTTPIPCRDAIAHLWTYLDDELDPRDHDAVEAHLAFCLRCCGELAFAREVRSVLAHSHPSLPDDARVRLEAFIDDLGLPDGDARSPT